MYIYIYIYIYIYMYGLIKDCISCGFCIFNNVFCGAVAFFFTGYG